MAVPPTYGRLCNCASTLSAGLPFWNFLNYSFTYCNAYNVLVLCNHWIKKNLTICNLCFEVYVEDIRSLLFTLPSTVLSAMAKRFQLQ